MISDVDVSGAKAGATYTFSYDENTDELTLTRSGDNATQTITISGEQFDNGKTTLSFNALGVSIVVVSDGSDGADDIGNALGSAEIITQSGGSAAEFLIGSNGGADETLKVAFSEMSSKTLGSGAGQYLSDMITDNTAVDSKSKAEALIKVVDDAINKVSSQRSLLGAAQNRLEHTINNLSTSSENLTAAESRIRDADMAKELMEQTKNAILSQAAQAMLAQANQLPQGVLQLLR